MRAIVQLVSSARVKVLDEVVGAMETGLLCLIAAGHGDTPASAEQLAHKLVNLRIFPDAAGRMDRSLLDVGGALGVISQFTLYGDTRRGRRPFFGDAAAPEIAEPLLETLVAAVRAQNVSVITGRFGADMDVELVNRGPVTLWIDTDERR